MSDIFGYILLGVGVLIALSFVIGVILIALYYRRMRITYVVFMPNKKIVRAKSREGVDHMTIDGANYFYDEGNIFYNKIWGKQIHFYWNNPYSIDYYDKDFHQNYECFLDKKRKAQWKNPLLAPKQSLSGKEQHSMLHSHLISELFLSENGLKIIMVLLIAVLVGLVILGFVNHPPAAAQCLNINQTMQACKAAMRGVV